MSVRFLRYSDLKPRGVPWSQMHLSRLEKERKFPKRVQLGPGTTVWVEAEIEAFLADKLAARETVAA